MNLDTASCPRHCNDKGKRESGPSFGVERGRRSNPATQDWSSGSVQNFRRGVNVKLGMQKVPAGLSGEKLRRAAFHFVIQDDRFGDLLHGLSPLLAFAL